jgi:hypothetical protein
MFCLILKFSEYYFHHTLKELLLLFKKYIYSDLQERLLRDKQFGDKGEMPPKFKWNHCARPLKNNQG